MPYLLDKWEGEWLREAEALRRRLACPCFRRILMELYFGEQKSGGTGQ